MHALCTSNINAWDDNFRNSPTAHEPVVGQQLFSWHSTVRGRNLIYLADDMDLDLLQYSTVLPIHLTAM